jgi:chromosome segregation ATPase
VTPDERAVVKLTTDLYKHRKEYLNAVQDIVITVENNRKLPKNDRELPNTDQLRLALFSGSNISDSIDTVNEALIIKAEKVNDLKNENKELENENKELKNENKELKNENKELERHNEELERYNNKCIQRMEKHDKSAENIINDLENRIAECETTKANFGIELTNCDKNNDTLLAQLQEQSKKVKLCKKKCAGKNALSSKSRYSSQNKDIVNNDDYSPELEVIPYNPYLNRGGIHSSNHMGGRNSKSKKHSPNKRNTKKTRKHHKKHTRKHK